MFDATLATGRDDVVLAHLNHRLVQMCLRLLRAEVWALSGRRAIHRVSAQCLPSGTPWRNPLIIAHGRIVVLGGDHHRLHEEVIMAGGEISAGAFNRLNVGQTRDAYAAATLQSVPEGVCQRLAALSGRPVQRLSHAEATARGAAWLLAGAPTAWVAEMAAVEFAPSEDAALRERYRRWCAALDLQLAAGKLSPEGSAD